jgi:hypothetical protein
MALVKKMVRPDDGGPAFPHLDTGGDAPIGHEGLTKREWFAGQALAGAIANLGLDVEEGVVADAVVKLADVLVAELRKRVEIYGSEE